LLTVIFQKISSKYLAVDDITGIYKALFVILISLLTLLTGCNEQVSTPAAGQIIKLQNEQNTDVQLKNENGVNSSMPANEETENKTPEEPATIQAQNIEQPAAQKSETLIPTPDPDTALPLLLDLTELSVEAYIEKHGLEDKMSHPVTAAATRIAKVTVNPAIFNQEAFTAGKLTQLWLFENTGYKIRVTNYTAGSPASFSGASENGYAANFYASIGHNTLLATLEVPAQNKIFLIKYSPKTKGHYLFQAPLQNIGTLEDSPPKIPPVAD
jgi:hypothetical protein